jgi:uncharacterized UBP type Zn finger protein
MRLSLNDYKSILNYYNIDISAMKNITIKNKAESILAEKLCRCIKSIDNPKTIAVCKNSVFTKKNLKISKFSCKKKAKLLTSKKNTLKLRKTSIKLRL